jgi:hypothetical protein
MVERLAFARSPFPLQRGATCAKYALHRATNSRTLGKIERRASARATFFRTSALNWRFLSSSRGLTRLLELLLLCASWGWLLSWLRS